MHVMNDLEGHIGRLYINRLVTLDLEAAQTVSIHPRKTERPGTRGRCRD